ncbi:MAG: NUDIX domain-containing protein [Candidatus Paceibacterota bacterium]
MEEEKILLEAVLCFLVRGEKIRLAQKTQKIGEGYLNGYGGGIEEGEKPREAVVREIWEEAWIKVNPKHLKKVAIIYFHNTRSDGSTFVCRVHVYIVRKWQGKPKETETMVKPTMFNINNLPFEKMMPADRIWLPIVLKGRKIIVVAKYGPFQKKLFGGVEIHEVSSLPDDE